MWMVQLFRAFPRPNSWRQGTLHISADELDGLLRSQEMGASYSPPQKMVQPNMQNSLWYLNPSLGFTH